MRSLFKKVFMVFMSEKYHNNDYKINFYYFYMADVKKLSASKITTYKGCSMAFYLHYIVHEKVPTNVRFVFGKGIHYMLEQFYKKNFKSPDSFAGFWNHYWSVLVSGDNLKGKQKENLKIKEYPTKNGSVRIGDHINIGKTDPVGLFFGYMKLGQQILKNFYKRHIPEKMDSAKKRKPPIFLEKGFGNRKDEPFEINGHPVQGFLDRIDKTKEGYYITDYKTNKKSPALDSFTLHRNIQFTMYSYAFRKLFSEKEKGILFYHLRSNKVFKTQRSEKDYEYMKQLLDEVAEGISKDIFVPFYGFHCNFCDYKIACEKYSIKHRGGPRLDLETKIKGAPEFKEWDAEIPEWLEEQYEN